MTLQFIAPTKRRGMTRARAARIFLDANGICSNCGLQIRQGEQWFVEHVTSLAQGGADDDKNARPAHTRCKAAKDAADAASKAKRDRLVTAGWDSGSKPKMRGAGFRHAAPQHKATTPIAEKFPGDIRARNSLKRQET